MPQVESLLAGERARPSLAEECRRTRLSEIAPIDSARSSREYRKRVAKSPDLLNNALEKSFWAATLVKTSCQSAAAALSGAPTSAKLALTSAYEKCGRARRSVPSVRSSRAPSLRARRST